MSKENILSSEYFSVPANNINSWGTSSRGIIFIWGADTEQLEQELEDQQFPKQKDRI
jgi:hypothetical protein